MRFAFRTVVLVATLLLSACATGGENPPSTIIHNVTLLDGRGGPPLPDAYVKIAGDRIVEVGSGSPRRSSAQTRIDGGGGWLLPGFIDMHAHLLIPRCNRKEGETRFDLSLSEAALARLLDFGVTSVRSPATPTVEGLALRDSLRERKVRGPLAFASAEFINDMRASPDEIRAIVRDSLPHRPDFVKAYSGLGPEAVAALVDEAHRHGIRVIGHLQRTSWLEGLEIGVDQLTHAVDWSPAMLPERLRPQYREAIRGRSHFAARIDWLETIDLDDPAVQRLIAELVRRRTPVDPTLVAYASKFTRPDAPDFRHNPYLPLVPELHRAWLSCSPDPSGGWTTEDYDRWERAWPKLLELVRRYHEAGVLLTTGSDFTNPWLIPGESLHQEFELLSDAGIPNSAILAMTGANAAETLQSDEIGIVEPGRRADLVLLSRNPLEDIRNSRSISWVMQAGRIESRGPRKPVPAGLGK